MDDREYKLRKLYGELILGASHIVYNNEKIFIRHFSPLEQAEVDGEYLSFFKRAVEKGMRTEKERLEIILKEQTWTQENEKNLEDWDRQLQGKIDTKKNLVYQSQITQISNEITELTDKIQKTKFKREHLIGMTAESFARRKLNEIYIFTSLFKDKKLEQPLFTFDEFEELDEIQLQTIVSLHNEQISNFQRDNAIARIAAAPFFQKFYNLCDDNIYNFFGKPIVSLTFFQVQLAEFGRFFKHVFSQESKPPQEVMDDPDKIIDWYNRGNNTKKLMQTHENNQVTTLMGSAEDVRSAAQSQGKEIVSFASIAAKEGKTKLNKQDLMKILG